LDALVWALPVAAFVCAVAGLVVAFGGEARGGHVPTDATAASSTRRCAATTTCDGERRDEPGQRSRSWRRSAASPPLADDLDREHEAGDVDDDDYEVLRDGYTARAAAVLRSIEEGTAAPPGLTATSVVEGRRMDRRGDRARDRRRAPRRASVGDSASAGRRSPAGRRSTTCRQAVRGARRPRRVRLPDAARALPEVQSLDPGNLEARTYTGWLLALSAGARAPTRARSRSTRRARTSRRSSRRPDVRRRALPVRRDGGAPAPEPDLDARAASRGAVPRADPRRRDARDVQSFVDSL
jgi:hypothetical protein